MEYVYAGMLLHKAGKEVTADAVKKVLEAAGVQVDEGRVKALVAALDGVDIDAAIKDATVVAPVAATPAGATAPAEAKKEEPKEEEKKDSAAGLGALFG